MADGRSFLSTLTHLALVIQLAWVPPVAAYQSKDVSMPSRTPEAAFEPLHHIFLDSVVREYHFFGRSPESFIAHYFSSLPKKLREEWSALIRLNKTMPQMRKDGLALVVTSGKAKVRIEQPNLNRSEFFINGVFWRYNVDKALEPQIALLARKLELRERETSALWRLVRLDRAHAYWFLLTPILNAIGSGIGAMIVAGGAFGAYSWYCSTKLSDKNLDPKNDPTLTACLRDKADRERLAKDGVTLDTVKNMIEKQRVNILENWQVRDKKCPVNNDGKDRIYSATITNKVCVANSKKSEIDGCQSNVLLVFDPNGLPKDGFTTPVDVNPEKLDTTDPENLPKIKLRFVFMSDNAKLGTIRVYDKDSPTKTIDLNRDLQLSPLQKSLVDQSDEMLKMLNLRIAHCAIETIEKSEAPAANDATKPTTSSDKVAL